MMTKWLFLLLCILLLTIPILCGKNSYLPYTEKTSQKKHQYIRDKTNDENRFKRSLRDENRQIFMPINTKLLDFDLEEKDKKLKSDLELPFWGTRGRRDSFEENLNDMDDSNSHTYDYTSDNCKQCYKSLFSSRKDESLSPFWGNRGRRNSDEIGDNSVRDNPFWGNRGRRQEDETRGSRHKDLQLLGNRGGRDETKPKSERLLTTPFSKIRDETEPFWGNRGRRREAESNWIHNIMHEETEPFWGNRGRKKDDSLNGINVEADSMWRNRGRYKTNLKNTLINTIIEIEGDREKLLRLQRNNEMLTKYWPNRERYIKLQYLFKVFGGRMLRRKPNPMDTTANFGLHFKPSEPETVLDDRIYAEQPHYILVERSSRSSAEDDPYFISRGKKLLNKNISISSRGRRGAIEELVKSVKNDPYYIARGKKDSEYIKIGNSTISKEELEKAEELICSTIDLLAIKEQGHEFKREIDSERDRRTILKKLTAQLQVDPYFVSRGKKSNISIMNGENLEEFINQVDAMCA